MADIETMLKTYRLRDPADRIEWLLTILERADVHKADAEQFLAGIRNVWREEECVLPEAIGTGAPDPGMLKSLGYSDMSAHIETHGLAYVEEYGTA